MTKRLDPVIERAANIVADRAIAALSPAAAAAHEGAPTKRRARKTAKKAARKPAAKTEAKVKTTKSPKAPTAKREGPTLAERIVGACPATTATIAATLKVNPKNVRSEVYRLKKAGRLVVNDGIVSSPPAAPVLNGAASGVGATSAAAEYAPTG